MRLSICLYDGSKRYLRPRPGEMLTPGLAQRLRRQLLSLALGRSIKEGNELVKDGRSIALRRDISCD
jgi:hypothetical protein